MTRAICPKLSKITRPIPFISACRLPLNFVALRHRIAEPLSLFFTHHVNHAMARSRQTLPNLSKGTKRKATVPLESPSKRQLIIKKANSGRDHCTKRKQIDKLESQPKRRLTREAADELLTSKNKNKPATEKNKSSDDRKTTPKFQRRLTGLVALESEVVGDSNLELTSPRANFISELAMSTRKADTSSCLSFSPRKSQRLSTKLLQWSLEQTKENGDQTELDRLNHSHRTSKETAGHGLEVDSYVTIQTSNGEHIQKRKASSREVIERLRLPTAVLNALDKDLT